MLAKVYNQRGEEVGNTRLPKEVFGVKMNSDLVYQVAVSQMANRRQVIAHAKDRAEVRGGGAKPWRQKGTGRARHGSIRSPIWAGGGVTFGPTKERNFQRNIPKKMKRKALLMVLSQKAKDDALIILEKLQISGLKTKEVSKILEKLPCSKKSCLIGLPQYDRNIMLAARNIPETSVMEVRNLNVLDLLSAKYLLIPKDSIKTIEENFLNKKKNSKTK